MSAASPHASVLPSSITPEQVRSFVDDGYLVVPNLVDAATCAELKADMLSLARGAYPCPSLSPVDPSLSDEEVLARILCIHQPHGLSPVMRRCLEHPRITDVLSRIVGAHLPFWDGAVKCMQSMLFVKSPGKPGQAWHIDEMYIPTRDRSLCGAWIAIDDATIANGCLWVIPGSHRPGYLYPSRPPTDLVEYDGNPECYGFDPAAAVPVEVAAGSVVFFNGYLLHKSLKNRSGMYRRSFVCHYMNAWSLLPWDLETTLAKDPAQRLALADNRCVIQVAGSDPYAWKGIVPPAADITLRSFHSPPET